MAVTAQDQTGNGSPTKMEFWDGMDSVFLMPNITLTERRDVWDAVSSYIQQQLLQHKGVRIPTLGSFDVVCTETCVGDKTVALQRPVFHLARNLGGVHDLMDNKDDLIGDKQLEPLKYAKAAEEASVSRRKVEECILGTTSLLYHCLRKGETTAFVLRDVGVLLIEGRKVQMRFYPDFLEKMTEKKVQERTTLKVLQQLGIVLSRGVPIASLASTSRVIIFPEFEQESLPMPLPRDSARALRDTPGGDKWKKKEDLPPVRRGMEGRLPGLPMPAHLSSTAKADQQPWDEEVMKDSSRVRKLPAIPRAGPGKKQPVTDQARDKPTPKGQVSKQSHAEPATAQRGRERREGEAKDSLGKEGEKKVHLVREGDAKDPLRRQREKKAHLGREEAAKDSLGREGEMKVHPEKEGEKKVPLEREGEKEVHPEKEEEKKKGPPKKGEKKVPPGKKVEKEVSPSRKGEKEVSPRRKGEKKVHFTGEEVKYPLGREGEKKRLPGRGEKKFPHGSTSLSGSAQALKPQDLTSKVFILQRPRPEAAQGLKVRPEAFWSVLKEPQRSILAGYTFEPSLSVPPSPPKGDVSVQCPVPKRRDVVSRALWPWME